MNFIKSLIFPTHMNKYRHMSGLIALLIFLVGSYLLTIPGTFKFNKTKYDHFDLFSLDVLAEMPSTEENDLIFSEFKSYACTAVEGELHCEVDIEDINQGEAHIVSYDKTITLVDKKTKEETKKTITNNIYFVWDLYDYKTGAKPVYNIADNFDNLPRAENIQNYLVVFYKHGIVFRIQPALTATGEIEKTFDNTIKWEQVGFSTNNFGNNATDAGVYLAERLMDGYQPFFVSSLLFNSIFMGIAMTAIIVLIVWLISKRNGRLKTFGEYYNMAAISSIIIFLVFLILFIILPIEYHSAFMLYFNSVFALYYLFIIFKLNSLPEII